MSRELDPASISSLCHGTRVRNNMRPSAVFRAFTTNGHTNRQAVGTGSRFDNLAKIENVLVPKFIIAKLRL